MMTEEELRNYYDEMETYNYKPGVSASFWRGLCFGFVLMSAFLWAAWVLVEWFA